MSEANMMSSDKYYSVLIHPVEIFESGFDKLITREI